MGVPSRDGVSVGAFNMVPSAVLEHVNDQEDEDKLVDGSWTSREFVGSSAGVVVVASLGSVDVAGFEAHLEASLVVGGGNSQCFSPVVLCCNSFSFH